jgi:hypothetical protein
VVVFICMYFVMAKIKYNRRHSKSSFLKSAYEESLRGVQTSRERAPYGGRARREDCPKVRLDRTIREDSKKIG